jgi:uncharacterized protein (TIGR03067 family)
VRRSIIFKLDSPHPHPLPARAGRGSRSVREDASGFLRPRDAGLISSADGEMVADQSRQKALDGRHRMEQFYDSNMKHSLTMFFCGAVMLASGCAMGPSGARPGAPQPSDSVALQGTWRGRELGAKVAGSYYLVVSGTHLEFRGADPNEWYKGIFSLRENKEPRQLVAAILECSAPEYVGQTVYAIYRIEGNTLTLAGNEPGNPDAPLAFDAPGARHFVFEGQ